MPPYQLIQLGNFISIGSVAIQAWELVAHLTDEVEYLWGGKLNFVKVLYFFSRYVFLAAQIVNHVLSFGLETKLRNAGANCGIIFAYKTTVAHASLAMLEIVLYIRVYALYRHNRRVKYFLAIVYMFTASLKIAANVLLIQVQMQMNGCDHQRTSTGLIITFWSGVIIYQFVILALSLYKLVYDGRLSRTPLTALMLREGVVVFILLMATKALFAVLLIFELQSSFIIGRAIFSYYFAAISVAASSLILNMRKLTVKAALYPPRSQNISAEEVGRLYNTDQSICLTSFYE
ncbi:hypothetical protein BDN70DRAFT_992452 [Pholiota conissans]|uniref:DUF6533 domain-containing protein n=1 Tax=Pholiota conissans TaxID=109636 RepID=A0A9P6D1T7_9AGAR|nr:hypothetical protein BDN70DRAFT_992452 [Pholiota conissans]